MEETCGCIIEDLLIHSFSNRNIEEKKEIIDRGKPTPILNNLITHTNTKVRRFSEKWYANDKWLCGCKQTSSLYCWPCLLFSKDKNIWTAKGVGDINSFHVLKKRHEASVAHVNCKIELQKFENGNFDQSLSLALQLNKDRHNENVKSNRYIVSCLIDAMCFLAEQELPFRGHVKNSQSDNRGNYIELLHHRASYDDKLRHHLEISTIFVDPTFDIQDNLIDCILIVLFNEIKEEVEEAQFVSVIEAEATDVRHKSQLSTVLRYVTPDGVQERFIRFIDVSFDYTAVSLANHFFNLINEFQIKNKIVAQTYDGCSVMARLHKDLQQIILVKYINSIICAMLRT